MGHGPCGCLSRLTAGETAQVEIRRQSRSALGLARSGRRSPPRRPGAVPEPSRPLIPEPTTQAVGFRPEQVVDLPPERVVGLGPEQVAGFTPERVVDYVRNVHRGFFLEVCLRLREIGRINSGSLGGAAAEGTREVWQPRRRSALVVQAT
jgi:hypothetical protein